MSCFLIGLDPRYSYNLNRYTDFSMAFRRDIIVCGDFRLYPEKCVDPSGKLLSRERFILVFISEVAKHRGK